jgi:hypothetical protein
MNYFSDRSSIIIGKDKVVNYLLNPAHKDGWSKAKILIEYGFHPENWEIFVERVKDHAQVGKVVLEIKTQFGLKIIVNDFSETPSRKNLLIKSIWIVVTNVPILVTLYPSRK